jgi:hypothetical protein
LQDFASLSDDLCIKVDSIKEIFRYLISDLEMSNFVQDQGKQRIARRRTDQYAAQVILRLDADIGQKGHF